MSILGEQIKELLEAARQFEGYQNGEISRMMREAAYTIESLRDRLQAATLGSGTCRNVHKEWEKSSFAGACTSFCCSECGAHYVDGECYYAESDSREKLEADVQKWCGMYAYQVDMVIVWLNRQAAITRREIYGREQYGEKMAHLNEVIDDLQGKLDYLEAHGITIVDAVAGGFEIYDENKRKADELQAQVDSLRDIYVHGARFTRVEPRDWDEGTVE